MISIGCDPGLRHCGLAQVGDSGRLVWACLVKNPEREDDGPNAWRAMALAVAAEIEQRLDLQAEAEVSYDPRREESRLNFGIERQQIRGGGKRGLITRNPAQVICLAQVAGAIVAKVEASRHFAVWPSSWNKSKKKEEVEAAIMAGFDGEERSRFEDPGASLRNNVADAVGIARWVAFNARLSASTFEPAEEEPEPWMP